MSPTPIARRKARLLLSVVDRHMTDHMRDPKHMTSDQLNDYETLLEIQGELTQVAHAPEVAALEVTTHGGARRVESW